MKRRTPWVLTILLALAGCTKHPPKVELGVDLYLHPESASIDDILLQAAVQKKIVESLPGRAGLIHVRVIEKVIFLSGSVLSDDDRKTAVRVAGGIDLKVDGKAIQPAGDVHFERLEVTH